MSELPPDFIADVRYPIAYPSLDEGKWFQWRSIPMIEHGALQAIGFRFVGGL
jgi:hypothetical protein